LSRRQNNCEWKTRSLEPAGIPRVFIACPLTTWPVGITSTPVIDPATNRVYVVARNHTNGSHWLHVIDLSNGTDLNSVEIKYDLVQRVGPSIAFEPAKHFNRAGLLLVTGRIFIGFGSMCDRLNSHGWVFSYDAATLDRLAVYCVSPNAIDDHVSGGVWQSGNGIAGDEEGNYIYFMTGNGEFDFGKRSFGSSVLQLSSGDLSVVGYFTPNNQEQLSEGDVDLGSGGPMLLTHNLLLGGGKQGRFYLLNRILAATATPQRMQLQQNAADVTRDHLDGFQAFVNTHHFGLPHPKPVKPVPLCPAPSRSEICPFPQVVKEDDPLQVFCARKYALQKDIIIPKSCYGFNQYYGPNIHGGPLYWRSREIIFGTAEKDHIRAFRFYGGGNASCREEQNPGHACIDFEHPQLSELRAPDGMPGGFLSLSADEGKNGLIWASFPKGDNTFYVQSGRLVALDAETLQEVWSDDQPGIGFAKFCPPTIANGKVFRAAFVKSKFAPPPFRTLPGHDKGQLIIYGLLSTHKSTKLADSKKRRRLHVK
ncbi:MAG TPA: hypothetical protein VJS64_05405, partial [Pyrinomonadaceae bacterium]|nr:hypothetical protein [Pyrinomonadaceae bacterium]